MQNKKILWSKSLSESLGESDDPPPLFLDYLIQKLPAFLVRGKMINLVKTVCSTVITSWMTWALRLPYKNDCLMRRYVLVSLALGCLRQACGSLYSILHNKKKEKEKVKFSFPFPSYL